MNMAETPEIVYHNTLGDVRAAFASLEANGGYTLYVAADGTLHALALAVTTRHGIRWDA